MKKNPGREKGRRRLAIGAAAALAGLLVACAFLYAGPLRERFLAARTLAQLQQASVEHPEDVALQAHLAGRLLEAGQLEPALAAARGALRAAPRRADLWVLYGRVLLVSGDPTGAVNAGHRALELAPSAAEARLCLGEAYLALDSSHGAIDQLRRYTALRPRDPEGWGQLARAFAALEEPGNALEALKKAAALRPSDAALQAALGEAYLRTGSIPEAQQAVRAALAKDSRSARALTLLGQITFARAGGPGEREEALRLLRAGVEADPGSAAARFELGQALLEAERLEEAARELEAALRRAPGDPRSHHALAQAYAGLGRTEAARRHRILFQRETEYRRQLDAFRRRLQRGEPQAPLLFSLARVQIVHGRKAEAAETLRQGLLLEPGNQWAAKRLAQLQEGP